MTTNHDDMIDPRLIEIQARVKRGESVLKAIRENLGYSQQELANRIGVGIATLSRWERGKPALLTLSQVKALNKELKTLGMTVDNLPDSLGPSNHHQG